MKYDGTIKINIAELENAQKAFGADGKVYELLETAHTNVNNMTDVIYEEIKSLAYSELGKILEDISDSQRGLENNFEDVSKTLNKYLESRTEGITIISESSYVTVSREIKQVNNNLKRINGDIQDILRGNFPTVSSFAVFDDDKRMKIDAINSRIEATENIQNTNRQGIETAIDVAKELCYTVEEWFEDDYNEGAAFAIGATKGVATAAIGIFCPVGLAVIVGGMAAREFYREGYGTAEALVIGVATGAVSIVTDKVGGVVTKKCGELLKSGVSSVSKYADDLIKRIDLPTNIIRDRLESISVKKLAFQIQYAVVDTTQKITTITGKKFNSVMIETSTQFKRIEINGQVFTPDFAKMYDDLLAKSIANLDNLHSTSSTAYEKFVSTMKKEYDYNILRIKGNISFSGFLSEIAETTIEDSINELVDNLSTNVKRQLGIDDYTFEHDFRNELIKEVREGLVSIAF